VGLRDWQLGPSPDPGRIEEIAKALNDLGMSVCSITGSLKDVAALAPVARRLGVKVLQVSGTPQELSDAAGVLDGDMRIGPQMHTGGEYETVALAAATLRRARDARVGVVVEPANHMFAGEKWSPKLFAPLARRIIGCNLQSVQIGAGDQKLKLRDGTERVYGRVPAGENSQADFAGFFAALRGAGYDGWVNVIEPARKDQTVEDLARLTAEALLRWMHEA